MSAEPSPAAAVLASPVRRRLVDTLVPEVGGGRSAADLAQVVGLHVTTVRFHLDQLVSAGLVRASLERREGAGRPRKVYSLVREPDSEDGSCAEVDSLRLLNRLLVEMVARDEHGERLPPDEVGRRWALEHGAVGEDEHPADTPGRWLSKIAQIVEVLEQWGYTPEVSTSHGGRTADLTLSACPFLDLARTNSYVVCGIHRGIIAGSLERLGENATQIQLQPFVGPSTCHAKITTTTPFRPSASKESA